MTAGTTIPPTAATTGSAARRGSRRSPATNSRLSSRPATKKKIASSPSAAQVPRVRSRCSDARPDREVAQVVVGVRPAACSPRPARSAAPTMQQQAAGRLRAQDLGDPGALQERAPGEEPRAGCVRWCGTTGTVLLRGSATVTADQTSRRTWSPYELVPARADERRRLGGSVLALAGVDAPLRDQVHHRGVGEGGDVADLAVLGHVAQQPAHDLAGAGLRAARGRS